MIDTHSHLWFDHFKDDFSVVLERAQQAGVHTMVQVGCDQQSSKASVELAEKYAQCYATVGLHPNDHDHWNDGKALDWMRELLDQSEKIVAIGETGIDYYRSAEEALIQQKMLAGQCQLANEYRLPVIIHNRHTKRPQEGVDGLNPAEEDVLKVLDELSMKPDKVIFHCFSGSLQMAQQVVERGWIISFSGVVTYPNAGELREVAQMVPEGQFVVETDCPFLPPQKYRGQRNEPAYIAETALVVAQARSQSVEQIEQLTDANASRIFGLKKPSLEH